MTIKKTIAKCGFLNFFIFHFLRTTFQMLYHFPKHDDDIFHSFSENKNLHNFLNNFVTIIADIHGLLSTNLFIILQCTQKMKIILYQEIQNCFKLLQRKDNFDIFLGEGANCKQSFSCS